MIAALSPKNFTGTQDEREMQAAAAQDAHRARLTVGTQVRFTAGMLAGETGIVTRLGLPALKIEVFADGLYVHADPLGLELV
jgi:transcription antitermination factor NusG